MIDFQISNHFKIWFLLIFFLGCSSVVSEQSGSNNDEDNSDWLISSEQVYVGTGRDAIPAIDNPSFANVSEIDFLDSDDLVLGIKIDDKVKAYPEIILEYHEIVNDTVADVPVSITFCPLTGSGIAWNRVIDGEETTFGVSGLIYKNNLIAYDRKTESYWSQMMLKGVHGTHKGKKLKSYQLVEMSWDIWKKAFPDSKVLQGVSGSDANYNTSPYGNYSSNNNDILYPIEKEDDRLERKTLGHGVLYNSLLLVYPIQSFPDNLSIINTTIGITGEKVVLAGSSKYNAVVSYSREVKDGTVLTLLPTDDELPIIMGDSEGNKWNIFGEAVSGPRKGETLELIPSYNAYWFAWADFFGFGPKRPIIAFP